MSDSVRAREYNPWITEELQVVSQLPIGVPAEELQSCAGREAIIHVAPDTERRACVFGDEEGERMARYEASDGIVRYAFSYRSDLLYYPVEDLCTGVSWCVYSAQYDSLLGSYGDVTVFVDDLSTRLKRLGVGYVVDTGGASELPFTTASSSLSRNGAWAALEARSEGVVRVDMERGAHRWVAVQPLRGAMQQSGPLNLAVSNDGSLLLVGGWLGRLQVHEVTKTCGYEGGAYRSYDYRACHLHNLEVKNRFTGYIHAQNLNFSPDGKRATGIVLAGGGYMRTVFTTHGQLVSQPAKYVAFGDSFTSGEGETLDMFYLPGTNTALNRCHVSSRSYPFAVASSLGFEPENRACSGARTQQVMLAIDGMDDWASPMLLSLSVGGNDIDVMGKLKSCLGVDVCTWAKESMRSATVAEMESLFPKLVATIQRLQSESAAPLFILGYPLVINEHPFALCQPYLHVMLGAEERRYMGEVIRHLNKVLEAAAAFTGVLYVNIENALEGYRLCDVSEAGFNGVRAGDDIAPFAALKDVKLIGAESFHPTPIGHELIAKRINEALERVAGPWGCGECATTRAPSAYWGSVHEVPRMLLTKFVESAHASSGDSLKLSLPARTFQPGSKVRLEVHSEVQILGDYEIASDGSLEIAAVIPRMPTGYHTLFAVGLSYSGEQIKQYQTIFVDGEGGYDAISTTSIYQGGDPAPHHISEETLGASENIAQVNGSRAEATTSNPISKVSSNEYFLVILLISAGLITLVAIFLCRRKV